MSVMGIKPGKPVLVLERYAGQERVRYGMATLLSMAEDKVAPNGEPAIAAVYWHPELESTSYHPLIVHFTHPEWLEGRAALAYEELPGVMCGVCQYCGCTDRRACEGGCSWADADKTVCSSCVDEWLGEHARMDEVPA